mgnify:CR=1 FL=1
MAFSATVYETMQVFVPETWEHFYFNPTLSPFKVPFILSVFLLSIWLIIIVLLAVLDDLFRQLTPAAAVFYLLGLGGLRRDITKALEWWKKAATQGHAEAQYHLGGCYSGEIPYFKDIPRDIQESRKWLQKAADQGHEKAKEALERLFHTKASS